MQIAREDIEKIYKEAVTTFEAQLKSMGPMMKKKTAETLIAGFQDGARYMAGRWISCVLEKEE